MRELDYYSGFEGEPEYVVQSAQMRIRVWQGDFDEVFRMLEPGPEGWEGIALAYNVCTLDDDAWEPKGWRDPDPADTLRRLEELSGLVPDGRARLFHEAYIELLRIALRDGGDVHVREE